MLSKFSVKKPYTVVVGIVLVIILGVVSIMKMSTDLLPNINLPYAIVITTYPGASPETVETTVTKPVESGMATISNIKNISSQSRENVSVVIMEFEQTANMDSASLEMRESLDQIKSYWPDGVGNPTIMKLNPDMLPIMIAAVDKEGLSASEVTDFVQDEIIPAFESIEGVASVSSVGDIEETIQVKLSKDKIAALNEKIASSLDKKFSEAEGQISSAQEQLNAGKEELLKGQRELNNQTAQAQIAIDDGKLDMATGLAVIETNITNLQNQLQELTASEAQVDEGIAALEAGIPMVEQAKQLLDAKAGIEAAIAAIDASGASPEEKASQKAPLEAQLAGINAGIAQAESQLGTTLTVDVINAKLEEMNGQLAEARAGKAKIVTGKEAINAGIEQLQQSKADIVTGRSTVNEKISELNEGKLVAQNQIDDAFYGLKLAEQQLNGSLGDFDSTKKAAYDKASVENILTEDMVKQLLAAQNFSMPAGYVNEGGESYLVRVGDKILNIDALNELVLFDMGMDDLGPIKLKDVAEVKLTDNTENVYAKLNGNNGIMLTMQKQTGYSTGDVADKINAKMEQLQNTMEGVTIVPLMDQGIYIDLVVHSVLQNLIMGGILAIIILFIFLRDIKPTVVIAFSIPISLITAIVCMYFAGVTINIISLSGLALGVGMLVDNSIVVIENIYRLRSEGKDAITAAVEGAKQVAGAIFASTLTTCCVFLPIVFTEGITRQLFVEMGLTITFSLLASLLIALTLVPMMGVGLLKKMKEPKQGLIDKLCEAYERAIPKVLKMKPLVFLVAIVLLVGSVFLSFSRGTAFMPAMESTQASVTVTTDKEKTFAETREISDKVVDILMDIEDVESVGAMAGGGNIMSMSASGDDDTHNISMYLILKEDMKLSSEELTEEIKDKTKDIDAKVDVQTNMMDMSALGGSGVSLMIKGNDMDTLMSISKDVKSMLGDIDGLINVRDSIGEPSKEFRISVNKDKASAHSLTVAQVFMEINKKLSASTTATVLSLDVKDIDVFVSDEKNKELTRDELKETIITFTNTEGKAETVALKDVADFSDAEGMKTIMRDGQTRYISVSASVDQGYNVGLIGNEVKKALADYEVKDGYTVELKGENETIDDAMSQLTLMLVLAVCFIYLIMVAQFQSLLSPFIIMFTIPLAFTGGFFGLWVAGKEVSVIAMIGFVMLSGIIVNNGIVLVDYINQLRASGMEKKEAIALAGRTRLRPILMTALTTILGLSTMALAIGMGAEMGQPMAIVTIGGMIYGTLLTLFVIPCIYDAFNRDKKKKEEVL